MVPIQLEGLTQLEKTARNIYEAFNLQEELTGERPNVTATEVALNGMSRRIDTQRFAYSQNYKEEDKMREEMWSLYQVIVVDKNNVEGVDFDPVKIDKKVVAKNEEHAKGLAGYYELLERKRYDNTKLAIRVILIMSIKPVEDDE